MSSNDNPPVTRTGSASATRLALIPVVLCVVATGASRASELELLSVGVRARLGEKKVLGKDQPESFREYDLVTTFRLPWEEQVSAGWALGARLLASAGVLQGADKTAFVASLIPVLAIGTQDWRFTLDLGAGLALLSRHRYAQQDYGGPFQAALTLGVSVPLHGRVAVGYRFLHYSDGGAYGHDTIGADFHMVELSYRF